MKIQIPENLTGRKLINWLIQNKSLLIAQKKFEVKRADAVTYGKHLLTKSGNAVKAGTPIEDNPDEITVSTVINTTFWIDSHKDVHINGIWKKSLTESKELYLLQEHNMTFAGIITDDVKAYTQNLTWQSLGVDFPGSTQALIFDNVIKRERNPFMFEQYRKGYVKNHSVGMRYVDIQLAVNDEDYKEEFALWNKYINQIANKQEAEETGYFFPVREAKVIEGSAVPIGSNRITPTLSDKNFTPGGPEKSTQREPRKASIYKQLLNEKLF